jgi:hypothetical protein
VVSPAGELLPIGKLRLGLGWQGFESQKSMLVFVMDKSGSMGGRAFRQVQAALLHMFHQTYKNRDVFSCIVPYDNTARKVMRTFCMSFGMVLWFLI